MLTNGENSLRSGLESRPDHHRAENESAVVKNLTVLDYSVLN
jgi:hypothetical protein